MKRTPYVLLALLLVGVLLLWSHGSSSPPAPQASGLVTAAAPGGGPPSMPQPPAPDHARAYAASVEGDALHMASVDAGGVPRHVKMWMSGLDVAGRAQEIASEATCTRTADGAQIDRGAVTEKYVLEKSRVEQILVMRERPETYGPIAVRTRVETTFAGPVVEVAPHDAGAKDIEMLNGGLWFTDQGRNVLAYYGALAIDATGRELPLTPHWNGAEVVLTVPAAFVAEAAFPLAIDPWVQYGGSASEGGVSEASTYAYSPALAVDSSGYPNIAWSSYDTATFVYNVYFKRWTGTSWEELAGSGSGTGVSGSFGYSFDPSIALDPATGDPFLAWWGYTFTPSFDYDIYVKHWDAAAESWVSMDGSTLGAVGTTGTSIYASIALDSDSNPVVAWSNFVIATFPTPSTYHVYLKKWDPVAKVWTELAGSASATSFGLDGITGAYHYEPQVRMTKADEPCVAWYAYAFDFTTFKSSYAIYYKEYDSVDGVWTELAGSGTIGMGVATTVGGYFYSPRLSLDASDDPVIAWIQSGTDPGVMVMHWDGEFWDTYGSTGEPVTSGYVSGASLAVDADSNPVIAWGRSGGGNYEIYLRRWNGTSWAGLDGSDIKGGVSSNDGYSYDPVVAVHGTVPSVAWVDYTSGISQIYYRTHDPRVFLAQTQHTLDGKLIPTGESTGSNFVKFRGGINGDTFQFRMQVEVQPANIPFTNVPTVESPLVDAGLTVEITLPLADGPYHWQARTLTDLGTPMSWVSYGGNAESDPDFVVGLPPPPPAQVVAGEEEEKNLCGQGVPGDDAPVLLALGLMLALLALRMRRRTA